MASNDEHAVIQALRAQGHGYKKIAQVTKIPVNTVKSYCRRHSVAQVQGRRPDGCCQACGKALYNKPRCKPKKFCSDACRMKWWNTHRDQVKRKSFYAFKCPYCGQEFESYGHTHRKYCSVECANAAQRKTVRT